jgi:predicted anti-sigma-YlaC factor YlaD
MNPNHADTRDPHLDLGNLLAGAANQPVSDSAREHLARCERCQREATRWNLVAQGVRGLAAAATPETASPAPRERIRRRVPRPVRHGLLVAGSVAAALVLFLGVGELAGFVQVNLNSSAPSTNTTLTAVAGCSQLELAEGTLELVNGNRLVIKGASGQRVVVTTTPTTFMSMSGALLNEIKDGASVMVRGSRSDGSITADSVVVGQPFSALSLPGSGPVQGTVSDASSSGFTLVTSAGTRIPVTTSSVTLVAIPHATPGQLQPGGAILAIGRAGRDGTLAAKAVAAIYQFSSGPRLGATARARAKGCSTRSIDDALGAIAAMAASGG